MKGIIILIEHFDSRYFIMIEEIRNVKSLDN